MRQVLHRFVSAVSAVSVVWVMLAAAAPAQAQVPPKLGYQGRLLKANGAPESGVVSMTFTLYAEPAGGTPQWTETQSLPLTDGYYATFLGDVVALPESVLDGNERFLELSVGGQVLSPRQRIASVAYAMRATHARNVQGGTADVSSVSVNGAKVIDGSGKLVGPAALTPGPGINVAPSTNAISLTNTGVTAGSYANANITVDAQGRITAASAGSSGSSVPPGLIGFFASACPAGWTEYAAMSGRLVLGLPAGGSVGATKGTAIGNLAPLPVTSHFHSASQPAHSHGIDSAGGAGMGQTEVQYISNGDGCCNDIQTDAVAPSITVFGAGDPSGPPYIQLRACQKS